MRHASIRVHAEYSQITLIYKNPCTIGKIMSVYEELHDIKLVYLPILAFMGFLYWLVKK